MAQDNKNSPSATALEPSLPVETDPIAQELLVGIDVGSTTVKAVALDPITGSIRYSAYLRHHARQAGTARALIADLRSQFPDTVLHGACCGSGGEAIAAALHIPFVQEVVANAIAVRAYYPQTRTAIELGGQDAKMVFFSADSDTGQLNVADMRMNGSCAGGTGAFIDEIASLLDIPIEDFDDFASRGTSVHNISGRCGVYAKTDIQPLLNQGVPKTDLALSAFHAIAKQTIGGLAQGLDIEAPVIFEGGPLTFNPKLIDVFAERLNLGQDAIVIPEHPETIVALGAALSLSELFAQTPNVIDTAQADEALLKLSREQNASAGIGPCYFSSDEERFDFERRHALLDQAGSGIPHEKTVRVYLGIDSGSTTTKFAVIDEDERLIASFYASNDGEPITVARAALHDLHEKCRERGTELEILALGTTGYGENLIAEAFQADYHTVETVAHARAACKYEPDTSFILDIGGQDMKAIWLDDGIITNIVVNEACSSGCGSFLEGFASTLNIPVTGIARAAFRSDKPAILGSRCTVFMNSSIVSEQRSGKNPDDIMAGLCRSIIENVFTKVIRVSNLDSLGDHIVVQGGTFLNDAVLRAFEQYVQKPVTRAPYPGLMGAIGIALLAKEQREKRLKGAMPIADPIGQAVLDDHSGEPPLAAATAADAPGTDAPSRFIGFDALDSLSFKQTTDLVCPFCSNHCNRTLIEFSTGASWITGNRCEKGTITGDAKDAAVRENLRELNQRHAEFPDLFALRRKLLFQDWPHEAAAPRGITIGLPRVLEFWERMPFWKTLFQALGFTVKLSGASTHQLFESGLSAVASDTICFPAKLVHGHFRNLARQKVDRIFMPTVTTVSSENTEDTSVSMCAIVKGYGMVMRNSDNPEKRWNIAFDNPLFHWFTPEDRTRQLQAWFKEQFDIPASETKRALEYAVAAQSSFKQQLQNAGEELIDEVARQNKYAVILAGRPYHNDPLVNHDLPRMFLELGVPVLPVDCVPGIDSVDLSSCRLDIVNNFHARMLSGAILAAENPVLEYAQIISFGCGHDAYLTDEIIRLMKEFSSKAPLTLKVDESDAHGPLGIRIRSFVDTINMRRERESAAGRLKESGKLVCRAPFHDPYPQKFTQTEAEQDVVLIPNTSHAFSRLLATVFANQGLRTESLPVGRENAIALGKKYVHNDICFPAQIVIGEALDALESGNYDPDHTAIGMGKYIGDCRLTHYSALLRKALDDAGYRQVPIITNDDVDHRDLHPGFKMNMKSAIQIAMTLPMIDVLEELLRKIRPYEKETGSADRAFDTALDQLMDGLAQGGVNGAKRGFKQSIATMKQVAYDRTVGKLKPRVLIVGEYLLNFHPGANHEIERYLEANGLEVIEARMTDVIRKTYFYQHAQIKEYRVNRPPSQKVWYSVADHLFEVAHNVTDKIARDHPLYRPAIRMPELVNKSDPIIHHTFDAGEGVLIPGEILHHAENGCRNFIILQPFGCLPNHVVGRGISKRLKELYPDAQILPLDYDPDVSFANLENRLQMLIMNAKAATS
ncbi:MAG: acyl-CoA dehydratase activase [Eggerthellaceae bacterium]|jgi:predicted CoA-substrate-specific enzyme activase